MSENVDDLIDAEYKDIIGCILALSEENTFESNSDFSLLESSFHDNLTEGDLFLFEFMSLFVESLVKIGLNDELIVWVSAYVFKEYASSCC